MISSSLSSSYTIFGFGFFLRSVAIINASSLFSTNGATPGAGTFENSRPSASVAALAALAVSSSASSSSLSSSISNAR